MALSGEYIEFIRDALSGISDVQIRKMFGGAGVFCGGVMFGLVADEGLYLKVDQSNQRDFEEAGMEPFIYTAKGKKVRMSYWQAPEMLLEDSDELTIWAEKSLAVARAKKK